MDPMDQPFFSGEICISAPLRAEAGWISLQLPQ